MINTILLIALLIAANLALFFFLYLQSRLRKKQQTKGLFFQSSVGPIYYQVHGKGKDTLLLLHGLGASSYCWRKLIPLLEKDFRVITCDLWGFGKSTKDHPQNINLDSQASVLIELLDELVADSVSIIGNSMGAHIGFWIAKCYSHRVKRIVAISPATYPKLVPLYIDRFHWVSKWTPFVVNHKLVRMLLLNTIGNPHNIDTEMVEAYLDPYRDPEAHHSFAASLKIIQDERVYNSLTSIETPTLILWGERDRPIQRHVIDDIVSKLPFVELQTHPKSGHSAMEEYPEWCAKLITPFLKS